MGIGKELFENSITGLAGSALGALGSQLGYGIGEMTGYNEKLRQDQIKQQQALTGMQYAANYNLMKGSYEQQLQMWNNTNYEAQMKHLQQAGLNPALLYAKGGAGGTTGSGGASVGGGQSSNAAQMQQANTAAAMQGMAMMKLKAETDLLNAQANKLNQEGEGTFIENVRKKYYDTTPRGEISSEVKAFKNPYSETPYQIKPESMSAEDIGTRIALNIASKDKALADSLLTNNRAMGYLQELANATKNADSQAIQAAAQKLAAEFNYGEYTNWKYWAQLGVNVFKAVK